jgi:hypothetical protein
MHETRHEVVLEQLSAVIRHSRKLEDSLKALHELEADVRAEAVTKIRRRAHLLVGAAEEVASAAGKLK